MTSLIWLFSWCISQCKIHITTPFFDSSVWFPAGCTHVFDISFLIRVIFQFQTGCTLFFDISVLFPTGCTHVLAISGLIRVCTLVWYFSSRPDVHISFIFQFPTGWTHFFDILIPDRLYYVFYMLCLFHLIHILGTNKKQMKNVLISCNLVKTLRLLWIMLVGMTPLPAVCVLTSITEKWLLHRRKSIFRVMWTSWPWSQYAGGFGGNKESFLRLSSFVQKRWADENASFDNCASCACFSMYCYGGRWSGCGYNYHKTG